MITYSINKPEDKKEAIKEGVDEGKKEGKKEGKIEGKIEGKSELLIKQLRMQSKPRVFALPVMKSWQLLIGAIAATRQRHPSGTHTAKHCAMYQNRRASRGQ